MSIAEADISIDWSRQDSHVQHVHLKRAHVTTGGDGIGFNCVCVKKGRTWAPSCARNMPRRPTPAPSSMTLQPAQLTVRCCSAASNSDSSCPDLFEATEQEATMLQPRPVLSMRHHAQACVHSRRAFHGCGLPSKHHHLDSSSGAASRDACNCSQQMWCNPGSSTTSTALPEYLHMKSTASTMVAEIMILGVLPTLSICSSFKGTKLCARQHCLLQALGSNCTELLIPQIFH